MKKVKVVTPENIEIEYTLANLGSRTAAAVIDGFIILGILLIVLVIPLIAVLVTINWIEQYYGWIIAISLLTSAIVFYGYFILMEMTMNGRTIGKRVLKIRTIRDNGQPITFSHSVIRNLFKLLIDLQGIGAVLIYFNNMHKRIGDMLASTIVVAEDEFTLPDAFQYESAENYKFYFLTDEEKKLLDDYFSRENSLEGDKMELKQAVLNYFVSKKVSDEAYADYSAFYNDLRSKLMDGR